MDIIGIKDSVRHLRFAADDLKAVRSVILVVEDDGYDSAAEAIKVIDLAIESIVKDVEEAIGEIDRCIGDEKGA